MRYEKFRLRVHNLPLINLAMLKLAGMYDHNLKMQIMRWSRQGKLIKLRRNMYLLRAEDRKLQTSRLYIAAEIYKPSYIGTEYALSFYGLIPERVNDITCITTKKTMSFKNKTGNFYYQHIQAKCFTGFIEQKDEAGLSFFMARPEKAVVDFIYLNLHRFRDNFKSVISESFRFQNYEDLNKDLLLFYSNLFASNKLQRVIKALIELKRGE
jgi:hypothetical protein